MVFPETEIQLCIAQMIRNSFKYVGGKFQKEFIKDLKLLYQAASEVEATTVLDALDVKWGKKYSLAVKP